MKVRHILPYHARESSHWKITDSFIHVFFTLPTPRDDKLITRDFPFGSNWINNKVGQFEETASGRGWERLTRSGGGCVLDGSAGGVEKESRSYKYQQSKQDGYSWTLSGGPEERAEAGEGGGRSFVKYLFFFFSSTICALLAHIENGAIARFSTTTGACMRTLSGSQKARFSFFVLLQ